MSKELERQETEMLPEYDFTGGVRGKYAARYAQSSNVIVLEHDVAEAFPTAEAVNEALRLLVRLAQQSVSKASS